MKKTIAFDRTSACVFLAVGTQTPSDGEWAAYLSFLRKHLADGGAARGLVWSYGGGPSALQRKPLVELMEARDWRIAVMTESALARGIITALSWFKPGHRAFSHSAWRQATEYLELTLHEAADGAATIGRLRQQVGH